MFNCKEGWEPLCQFLDVPVPNVPFPHKNKKGDLFDELMKTHPLFIKMKQQLIGLCAAVGVGVAVGSFAALKYFEYI